jgi:hypothetical protein
MIRMYWWPYGYGNGERYELVAALRLYRLKELPERERFEKAMSALITAWEQSHA